MPTARASRRWTNALPLLLASAMLLLSGCATRLPPVPTQCPPPPAPPQELMADPVEMNYLRSLLDASRTPNSSEPSKNGSEQPIN